MHILRDIDLVDCVVYAEFLERDVDLLATWSACRVAMVFISLTQGKNSVGIDSQVNVSLWRHAVLCSTAFVPIVDQSVLMFYQNGRERRDAVLDGRSTSF